MSEVSVDSIPHVIEAPSLPELQRRMLQNNLANKKFYKYFDIQKDGKSWIAFYYESVRQSGGLSGSAKVKR